MKTYMLLLLAMLFSVSCNSQKKENKNKELKENGEKKVEQPKGDWSVNKEYDEDGNLIRFDSMYSWSSRSGLNKLTDMDKDSMLLSFKSQFFKDFSHFEADSFFQIFEKDSLFSNHFFNDDFFGSDFGNDLIDINEIRQQMLERQKIYLEKFQKEFIKPKEDN